MATRQHVTLLFSDLCDSTPLGAAVDPEEVREIMHHIKAAADAVLQAHEGLLNQDYGDGVMAIFGFPDAQEDDVRRAVEAALEIHRVIPTLPLGTLLPPGFKLDMHSGIHAGLVVVGEGDPVQGRYELTGDPVNVASRLCSVARRNEIFVSRDTLQGTAEFFVSESLGALSLRGHEPIAAMSVTDRSTVTRRFDARVRRGLTGFAGRAEELLALDDALRAVADGHGRTIGISGHAGMGKTRLVEEFLRRIQPLGCAVYRGHCDSYGDVAPLQPILQMVQQFEQDEGARMALLDDDAASGHSDDEIPGDTAATVAGTFARALTALASDRVVVLFVDDWQWADDASRDVLALMTQSLSKASVLTVVTSRGFAPTDPLLDRANVIDLPPFDAETSEQIVASLLPEWFDLGLASQICDKAGGNPLFIEELCKSRESWTPYAIAETADEDHAVPDWLHGLIRSRVEKLPGAQAELVQAAAIIGNVVPRWLLESFVPAETLDSVLGDLANSDLLYRGDTDDFVRFKHGITRDVVYESVSLRKRRQGHARIAELLCEKEREAGNGDYYEALAYHYAAAADPADAARFAELAGDKAMAAQSLDRATRQYRAALVALDALMALEPPDGADQVYERSTKIISRWALCAIYNPSPDQLDLFTRAKEHGAKRGDHDQVARAEYWTGFVLYSLGRAEQGIAHLEDARRIATSAGNQRLATQAHAVLGQSYAATGRYTTALDALDTAIAVKRDHNPEHALSISAAYATICKALVQADLGDFAVADTSALQAIDAATRGGRPVAGSIQALYGAMLTTQGRWEDARKAARVAQAIARRVCAPYVYAMGCALEHHADWVLTRTPDALERVREATEWLETWNLRLFISFNYGWLAEAFASDGQAEPSRRYAARALRRARQRDSFGEAAAYRALATLAAAGQLPENSAHRYLDRAPNAARARGSRPDEALTLMLAGELHSDAARLVEADAMFKDMGMSWHASRADAALRALAGDVRA